MYLFNYVLLAGFACLLFSRDSRGAALTFLAGWAIYIYAILGLPEVSYYALSGAIELVIAYRLNPKYRAVAYLGYSLVLYNLAGFLLHDVGTDYPYFDIGYTIISSVQFLFLLMRAIPNGLNRLHTQHFMVRLLNFDSRGSYGRMYENTTTKG